MELTPPSLLASSQRPQARLTMLYRSTDRLCRCGAAVKNLAHSASFHSLENNAPENPGIKQSLGVFILCGQARKRDR
jgi:hypothetical protein